MNDDQAAVEGLDLTIDQLREIKTLESVSRLSRRDVLTIIQHAVAAENLRRDAYRDYSLAVLRLHGQADTMREFALGIEQLQQQVQQLEALLAENMRLLTEQGELEAERDHLLQAGMAVEKRHPFVANCALDLGRLVELDDCWYCGKPKEQHDR